MWGQSHIIPTGTHCCPTSLARQRSPAGVSQRCKPQRCQQPQQLQRHQQRHQPSLAAAASLGDGAAGSGAAGGAEQPPAASPAGAAAVAESSQTPDQEDETVDYIQHCQETYGKPGLIDFSAGAGGLPRVTLQHPSGASCELYLHGGAVTSWRHSDGRELLHLRERNAFDGIDPISGGIQLAWPQYGAAGGALPTHGFLQHLHWSVVDTAWREPEQGEDPDPEALDLHSILDWRPTVTLYADTDEDWAQIWPHKFEALYSVTIMQPDPPQPSDDQVLQETMEAYQPHLRQEQPEAAAAAGGAAAADAAPSAAGGAAGGVGGSDVQRDEQQKAAAVPSVLRCLLQVYNSDEEPFTFTTGLRTHFATLDIPRNAKFVKTLGLRGKYVIDYTHSPLDPDLAVEDDHSVLFGDMRPQNRLFVDTGAEGDVLFCPGSPTHFHVANARGFSDVAVVHPTGAAPREARHFVGIDSARAVRKVTLQPGQTWVGEMVLTAHDRYWDLPPWEKEDPSGVPLPAIDPEVLQPRRSGQQMYEMLNSDAM